MAIHYLSIDGWFDFDDIYELALRRTGGKPACFVEVGAYHGRSTCYMAERIVELELDVRFDVVDTFMGDLAVGHADLWPVFSANLTRAGVLDRIVPHRCTSLDAAAAFADASLDFVFIDASHRYEDVVADLAAWWPKLRPGGLIAGHDYTHVFPGVMEAVDRFVACHGLHHAFRSDRSSWIIYKSIAIDAIYCVNLPRRTDRRASAMQQFAAAGLSGRVTFFDAVDGAELEHPGLISAGQAGCAMSHLSVLRLAQTMGQQHVLVFEDDVELVEGFAAKLQAALARCPASYDICYVGALCVREWGHSLNPMDDCLARVGSVAGTHAYILNMECFPALEAGLRDLRVVVDQWYAAQIHRQGCSYVCTPYLAFQTAGHSDVAGTWNANGVYRDYVWA